jgi:hypothetical protein
MELCWHYQYKLAWANDAEKKDWALLDGDDSSPQEGVVESGNLGLEGLPSPCWLCLFSKMKHCILSPIRGWFSCFWWRSTWWSMMFPSFSTFVTGHHFDVSTTLLTSSRNFNNQHRTTKLSAYNTTKAFASNKSPQHLNRKSCHPCQRHNEHSTTATVSPPLSRFTKKSTATSSKSRSPTWERLPKTKTKTKPYETSSKRNAHTQVADAGMNATTLAQPWDWKRGHLYARLSIHVSSSSINPYLEKPRKFCTEKIHSL